MLSVIPDKIWLYRIIHIDTLEYILNNGIYTKDSQLADPNYISIGDSKLIRQRNDYPVDINPPNGLLGEYIPFYFGRLSPMLLNIKTGCRGIEQRSQSDIIYICCKLDDVIANCPEWCFTDGHAKNALTTFYNDVAYLSQIDWNIVFEKYWSNTEEDNDRMRRKQSEFLIKNAVPVKCIKHIVTNTAEVKERVQIFIKNLELNINVSVNPNGLFYY